MNPSEDVKFIRSKLSEPEILTQLAEEAAEVAQAALKLRRALTGVNPTPANKIEATDALIEELADVLAATMAWRLQDNTDLELKISRLYAAKLRRWAERLRR